MDQLENPTTIRRWASRRCRMIYDGFTFFHLIHHEVFPALHAAKGFVTPTQSIHRIPNIKQPSIEPQAYSRMEKHP
jgi:hypothetical protein